MSYFEPEVEVSSSSGREVMFSDCDTVDDDEAGTAAVAAAAGCAVPLAGLGGTAVWKLLFPNR
jgi:hypothetical protein